MHFLPNAASAKKSHPSFIEQSLSNDATLIVVGIVYWFLWWLEMLRNVCTKI